MVPRREESSSADADVNNVNASVENDDESQGESGGFLIIRVSPMVRVSSMVRVSPMVRVSSMVRVSPTIRVSPTVMAT